MGLFSFFRGVVSEANDEAHGARLLKDVQLSISKLEGLDGQCSQL